jgi:hypothetical protein
MMTMRGVRGCACALPGSETLVLAACQKGKPNGTVITAMLVVVAEAVHVLITACALADATCEGTQAALGLAFDITEIGFADKRKV